MFSSEAQSELIDQTKVKPFSFEKLLTSYDTESLQYKVLKVIGEFISYADSNAAMKNTLNKYEDKRTMAQLSVRQNIWVQSLLRLKNNEDINLLPSSIKNVIKYIETPDKLLSVFSEQRKETILKAFDCSTDMDLLQQMREIGIKSINPMNDGVLCALIFHTKDVRKLWDNKEHIIKRIWSYSPGKDACMWDKFLIDGIMAIDYEIGDLSEYTSKEDIKNSYKPDTNPMNDILALWQFYKEMHIGDRVYAKTGQNTVIGVGEVISEYGYDPNVESYKHYRKVKWIKSGTWKVDEKFAQKTLTDISRFKEFCKNLEMVVFAEDKNKYNKDNFLTEVFIEEEKYDAIYELLKRKKNIILQGAPGVGKTFAAKRLAYSIMGSMDDSRIEMIQFHQNYSYEDFVMGYRPLSEGGFELREGIFYQFCLKASNDPDKDYYFIIDEINRGNLSKIFGELLMLIESDKRGSKFAVPLTYKPDSRFSVPPNVYMIGMMNTADRSLAMIDYALRRRFSFIEIEPAFNTLSFKTHLVDSGVTTELAEKIIARLTYLNNQSSSDSNLGKGFRIGHSYFCNPSLEDNWYKSVIEYEINPLIDEYWFDNEEKAKEIKAGLLG